MCVKESLAKATPQDNHHHHEMTSLQNMQRLVSEARAVHNENGMQFLSSLPLPDQVLDLKSQLESKASNPKYKLRLLTSDAVDKVERMTIESKVESIFIDFYKTSIDIETALLHIRERTQGFFPGSEVSVGIRDIGYPWIIIQVSMIL